MGPAWKGLSPLEVVCDAGPLIHLDELGLLELLSDFQAVFVPVQVWDEVDRHRPQALRSAVRLQKVSVEVLADSRLQALARTFSLDLGEQAALSLMKQRISRDLSGRLDGLPCYPGHRPSASDALGYVLPARWAEWSDSSRPAMDPM